MTNIPTHLSPTRQFYKAVALALVVTFVVCLIGFAAFGADIDHDRKRRGFGFLVFSQIVIWGIIIWRWRKNRERQ